MAYSLPEWADMGAIAGAAKADVGQPFDRGDGKRLKGRMTWCNFLAYLQRCSLRIRKLHSSDLGQEIGRGRFFEVFRYEVKVEERLAFSTQSGDLLEAGTVVALKRVIPQALEDNRVSLDDSRQLKAIATEIQALTKKSLREHENIIEMYALVWEDRGEEAAYWPTMVMEYCPCTLAELQSERKSPLSTALKFQIIQGICFGFDALQEEEIIHGDVKSENVLIQVTGDGMLIPKLADFGSCVIEISSDIVEIGGTDPWRAPECVALNGKVPTDIALVTDLYSLGLLIWRIFLDGQNPFASLDDLDYISHNGDEFGWNSRLKDEEEYKSKIIQNLKQSEAVIKMVIKDIDALCLEHPGALDGFKPVISAFLIADPVARCNEIQNLKEGLDVESTERAIENMSRHEFSGLNVKLSQLPTSVFSVHEIARLETIDAEFRSGKPTQQRVFRELLELVQDWDSQKNIECPACCAFSCFDRRADDRVLSLDDYLQCLRDESDLHTCLNSSSALAYDVPVWSQMGSQNEIFAAAVNLFVCYVEGYGVEINVDAGLQWLLKAAKWGSATAQGELATCFLHAEKAIPLNAPVVKWAMHSIVMFDSIPPRDALAIIDPVCLEIACTARQKMFNGISVDIEYLLLDPIKDIEINENKMKMTKNGEHRQLFTQLSGISPTDVNEEGEPQDVGGDWDGNGPLHWIASSWKQPLDLGRKYIEKYPKSLNATNRNGETPLLLACRSGRLSMVNNLLSLGAEATTSAGVGGETPLHCVALIDHEDVFYTVRNLLTRGADINALATELRIYPWRPPRPALMSKRELIYLGSPLHWAVLAQRIENVKLLVSEGAFIDLPNGLGMTPLSIAVSIRRGDILAVLLEGKRCADNDPTDRALLKHLYIDSTKYTRMLQGFNTEREERTLELTLDLCPLMKGQNHVNEFFKLVVYGVEAMPIGLLSKVLEKLDHCYSVSSFENQELAGLPLARDYWKDKGLLHFAVKRNDPEVLDLVLQKGLDIKELNNVHYTCLHTLAIHQGSEACLRVLVKHGALVDWRTNLGWLPFHFAIFVGNTKIAQALRELMSVQQFEDALGIIDSAKSSKFPMTFFGHAIILRGLSFASTRGIEWLLDLPDRVLDFKAVCPDGGYTPLHLAVDGLGYRSSAFKGFGGLPILRLLLARYRDPEHLEARSKNHLTALHLAAWLGKLEETRLLVEAGADVSALSPEGSPLDCAFSPPPSLLYEQSLGPTREQIKRFMEGRNAVAKYLRSHGAKSAEEIIFKVKLGDWVPYAINSGEHVEYFQTSSFARRRQGRSRYSCPAIRPQLKPEQFTQDNLTARELVIPKKLPD